MRLKTICKRNPIFKTIRKELKMSIEKLKSELKENFSPDAIVKIACHLQGDSDKEVIFLHNTLVALVGGFEHYNKMLDELHL